MNADRIAEIRERLNKATPGPWEYSDVDSVGGGSLYGNGWMIGSVDWANDLPRHSGSPVLDSDFRSTEVADANGELIAHAPDDLAFLLDLVDPASGDVETPPHWRFDRTVQDVIAERGFAVSHPNLAGEVETPCATCGGTEEVPCREALCDTPGCIQVCPDCGVETPEAAPEIIMDANGIYWRRYPTHLSMVPVSDDNLPVPKPYVVYRRVGTDYEGGFASTATGDLLARVEAAENRAGVETPEAAVEARRQRIYDDLREFMPNEFAARLAQGWTPPGTEDAK